MFGRDCRLPIDVLLETKLEDVDDVADVEQSWVATHQSRIMEAYQLAECQLKYKADRRKWRADRTAKEHALHPGERVYVRRSPQRRNKISDSWSCRVYKVVARQHGDNHNYVVEAAGGFRDRKTSRCQLRPCQYRNWGILP